MPSLREIKRRMKSVKDIMQITTALEAVSASKVRRATAQVTASRPYVSAAMEVLQSIAAGNKSSTPMHPLLTRRDEVGTVTMVLITSDRGLAGAYNSNIIRIARQFAARLHKPIQWVAIGRKGRDALIRAKENLVAEFTGLPSWITINDIRPIVRLVIADFLDGKTDEVYIAYTDFISTLTQKPRVQRFLPMLPGIRGDLADLEYVKVIPSPANTVADYIYEPSPEAILGDIVPKFGEAIVFQALLESIASAEAARMVAMRNASDNARDLSSNLLLSYNKARQSAITSEILDIVGGVEALTTSNKATAAKNVVRKNAEQANAAPSPVGEIVRKGKKKRDESSTS